MPIFVNFCIDPKKRGNYTMVGNRNTLFSPYLFGFSGYSVSWSNLYGTDNSLVFF